MTSKICGTRFTDATGRPAECNLEPEHLGHEHKWLLHNSLAMYSNSLDDLPKSLRDEIASRQREEKYDGPPIISRLLAAANTLSACTGAGAFTARLGRAAWAALLAEMEQMATVPPPRHPDDAVLPPSPPMPTREVVLNLSVGQIVCSLDTTCLGMDLREQERPRPIEAASVPTMTVAGYDANFSDIGSSIRVALPTGGHVTMGKVPIAKCFTDAELRDECARRRIDTMTPEMTRAWAADREQYLTKSLTHATDEQVSAEARRRNLWKPLHARMDSLTDEQLRVECTKRKMMGDAERRWEAASARCVELEKGGLLLTKQRDALENEVDRLSDKGAALDNVSALLDKYGCPVGVYITAWLEEQLKLAKAEREKYTITPWGNAEGADARRVSVSVAGGKPAQVGVEKLDSIEVGGVVFAAGIRSKGCAICGAPEGEPCTKECDDDSVPDDKVPRVDCELDARESGPGIERMPTKLRRDHAIDLATLADLLCAEE